MATNNSSNSNNVVQAPVPPPAPAKALRVNAYGYPLGIPRTGPLALQAMANRANVLATGMAAGTYGTAQSATGAAPNTSYAGAYGHYKASVQWCVSFASANPTLLTPALLAWFAVHAPKAAPGLQALVKAAA